MRTKPIFLLLVFFIVFSGVSNAQGGFLKNKLSNAINKQISNKADSAAAKSAGTNDSQAPSKGLGGLLGGKTDIKHNDQYNFTGMIYSRIESYDKKEVSKSDYYVYFNANTLNAGMELKVVDAGGGQPVPTQFIFDNDNRCFMMLISSEDSKTGIISTIPSDSALAAQASKMKETKPEKAPTITKTGNTKTIAGYSCDEYKVVEAGEPGFSLVWMTKDLRIKADKRNWGKTGIPAYYDYPGFEGATMLAMSSFDKNSNPEMKMETIEINENIRHAISTVGFSFIKMNFGAAGKK